MGYGAGYPECCDLAFRLKPWQRLRRSRLCSAVSVVSRMLVSMEYPASSALSHSCHFGVTPTLFQIAGEPRALWPREVTNFVPWLIANFDLLGRCLDIRLEFVGCEVPVGMLRADILARDELDRKVVIEAQLGHGDSDHLGKLVTYTVCAEADVAVWVVAPKLDSYVPAIIPEHRATLTMLNERFQGRPVLRAVEVRLESQWRTQPIQNDPLLPWILLVDLAQPEPLAVHTFQPGVIAVHGAAIAVASAATSTISNR